jgi:hypothetical protein
VDTQNGDRSGVHPVGRDRPSERRPCGRGPCARVVYVGRTDAVGVGQALLCIWASVVSVQRHVN